MYSCSKVSSFFRSPNNGRFYRISDSTDVAESQEADVGRSQIFHYRLVKIQRQQVQSVPESDTDLVIQEADEFADDELEDDVFL